MQQIQRSAALWIVMILISGGVNAHADTVKLKLLSVGAGRQMTEMRPQEMLLSESRPPKVKKIPTGLSHPLYGVLLLGPKESRTAFLVLVDAPDGKPSRLYVDANANGDLTDDPKPEWTQAPEGIGKKSSGGATLQVRYGKETSPLHLTLSRMDSSVPARDPQFNSVFYSVDYAREGEVTLSGKTYRVLLADVLTRGDFRGAGTGIGSGIFLLIDVNGNGKIDSRGEVYPAGKPFNLGGTVYEIAGISASGDTLDIVKSAQTGITEILPPPDLRVGKKVVPFEKTLLDGKTVRFPEDYKGRLVLLYFWASWCGDCRRELPYVVKAYERLHPQGLEILGASLEKPDMTEEQFRAFLQDQKMNWAEIYDNKWWKADLAQLYYVNNTPTGYLVDGDTGEILASGSDLEGDRLAPTIEKALLKKKH